MNFGENWTSKRWIFGENWTSSRWVLGKIRKSRILVTIWVQKDELWWKLDFKLMNFGENWFQKDEVWWKLDFKKVNFVFYWISKIQNWAVIIRWNSENLVLLSVYSFDIPKVLQWMLNDLWIKSKSSSSRHLFLMWDIYSQIPVWKLWEQQRR